MRTRYVSVPHNPAACPPLNPTEECSTHPALGPGDVGLKEVQQLLQEGPRLLGSGNQRLLVLHPQPTPCPMSPPCQDQGCQSTSTQQQQGCKPPPTPAPCHKGSGHPGVRGTPGEDNKAGQADRYCLASLRRGRSWCGDLVTFPPAGPAAGQGELTFLMMFAISFSRNSWVLLTLSSAASVCAWGARCSQKCVGGSGVPTSPPRATQQQCL